MKISVIIPCYQHAGTIGRCLASVFGQTHAELEVIVVDDGSTDGLEAAVAPFRDRLTFIRQENRGGPAARNRGFAASAGEAVIFCDADIILKPEALEKMLRALEERPEAAFAYSSFKFGWKKFRLWPFDAARLKKMNYIHTTSLIRRERFPGFDESLRRFQDWDLWLTIVEKGGSGVWIPETLFSVTPRRGGISEWLPSFVYRIPWRLLGFKPRTISRYDDAADIIRRKHRLP